MKKTFLFLLAFFLLTSQVNANQMNTTERELENAAIIMAKAKCLYQLGILSRGNALGYAQSGFQALKITEVNSVSGVKAYLFEDKNNPIVSVSFQFSGGASSDPIDKMGLSKMVSLLLDEGAGNFSSFDFQSRLENNGIRLNFNSTLDSFSGN